MYLHSNLVFLRKYTRTTQQEFGKIFKKTRSNIDSYERGNARPDEATLLSICKHFTISMETLIEKDLQMNPGLMLIGTTASDQEAQVNKDALKAKDETIRELRAQIKFLQEQNTQLLKKIKVA